MSGDDADLVRAVRPLLPALIAVARRSFGPTEWSAFRMDTGAPVGIGTTENRDSAWEDVAAWQRDGYDVRLYRRATGGWVLDDAV